MAGRKVRLATALALAVGIAAGLGLAGRRTHAVVPLTPEEQAVKAALIALWQREDDAAAGGDRAALPPLFDLTSGEGQAALRHAEARLAFVQAWAAARGVRWLPPRVSARTPAIRLSGSTVRVTAVISEAWTYAYPDGSRQTFGLGREHYLVLARTADGWRIRQDWFTDPLDQDTRIPGPARPDPEPQPPTGAAAVPAAAGQRPGYDRAGAVRYADTYCGAAPGCGNGNRYNPRFEDYNGIGGDCTNFVSQALVLGGRLPETGGWTYDRRTGEGTDIWVKAPLLVDYLVASGRARVAARGRFAAVAEAVGQLAPGDVVAYAERGTIVHLALVVGRDPHGYTLVDSHTADRYHVPWDIGWDRTAVFTLLHLRDAVASSGQAPAGPSAGRVAACGG
jgi:hypothetical protein